MATDLTKLTKHTIGGLQIQTSEGMPNHTSTLGTDSNGDIEIFGDDVGLTYFLTGTFSIS